MRSSDCQLTRAELLIAFCIEALNDVRVDKAWHQDYLLHLVESEQFSSFVLIELNDNANEPLITRVRNLTILNYYLKIKFC